MVLFGMTGRQLTVCMLGWIGYASTYLLRKPLGVVKADMQSELSITASTLGWMDTALILPYAVFQMMLSSVGDRFGAGITFGICLILDGLVMFTFGWWSSLPIFFLLLFLNGACQSICWPNATKVLDTWFPSGESRGTVFGVFGTSAFAGGFLGTALIVYLQTTYSWRAVFMLPSLIVSFLGVLVLLFYKEAPPVFKDILEEQDVSHHSSPSWASLWSLGFHNKEMVIHGSHCSHFFIICVGNPTFELYRMVPEVAIAALCVKVVRYAFYGWLPLYLYQHLKYTKGQAGMFSTMFDIGGVFGSALIGVFINKIFNQQALLGCVVGIFISTVALGLFMVTASWGIITNSVLLLIAGAFNCGPDTILVSLVPTDIGKREGRNAAAAITGLVNGFGSLGSVIQGPVIGFILVVSGWNAVLLFIVLTSAVGTAVTLRAEHLNRLARHSAIMQAVAS